MRFRAVIFSIAPLWLPVVALAQTQPSTAPSSQPAQLAERVADRLRIEASVAHLPRVPVASIEQAIKFTLRDGTLSASSPILTEHVHSRLVISNESGPVTLILPPVSPPAFQFVQHVITDNPPSHVIYSVGMVADRLTLARDADDDIESSSVQLFVAPPSDDIDPENPPVTLYITKSNETTGQREIDLRVTANSFRELTVQHSNIVNQYVRPIIAHFRQEAAIFAPDARAVWQVLSADAPRDESISRKLTELIARLDTADFRERVEIERAIEDLGQPGALAMMRLDRAALSPQALGSVEVLLTPYQPLAADDVQRFRDDPAFLLDALSLDDALARQLAWERLRKIAKVQTDFDPAADNATRARALAALRTELAKR